MAIHPDDPAVTFGQPGDDTAECGARHESSDVTGFRCELKPGHRGEHLTWQAVTWWDNPFDGVEVRNVTLEDIS